jgi:HEAT repeat protein
MQAQEKQPDKRRARRLYWAWGIGLGLLLAIGAVCWLVIAPHLRTKAVVAQCSENAIEQLGGPEKAAVRLAAFVQLPRWLTCDRFDRLPGDFGYHDLRFRAIEMLGECGKPAIDPLIRTLSHRDDRIRGRAALMFSVHRYDFGPAAQKAIPRLLDMLADRGPTSTPDVRREAAGALGAIGPAASVAVHELALALSDEDAGLRRTAVVALFELGPAAKPAVHELTAALKDDHEDVREAAMRALGNVGPVAEGATLQLADALLNETDAYTRMCAADALCGIGPGAKDAAPALAKALLNDKAREVRWSAAKALYSIGPGAKDAVPALAKALEDDFYEAQRSAARALGQIGPGAKEAIPALEKASRDSFIEEEAKAALKKIRGEEKEPTAP